MELRYVRSFIALAEQLHFARTAARLRLSPAGLTQQIKVLEKETRVRLFDRDRHHVGLTDAGAAFLPHARRLVQAADAALAEMREYAAGTAGALRVGVFVNNAAELTLHILQNFRAAFPNVRLTFVPLDFSGQLDGVLDRRVDVAFVRPPFDHEHLDVRVLGHEPRVAVVSATSDLADAHGLAVDDLADRRFIDPAALSTPAYWTEFWLLMPERGERFPRERSSTRLDDFPAVVLDIALNGTVTTVPASTMREMNDPAVTAVAIDGLSCQLAVAKRKDGSALAEQFCVIAARTADDLLHLVPDARPDPATP